MENKELGKNVEPKVAEPVTAEEPKAEAAESVGPAEEQKPAVAPDVAQAGTIGSGVLGLQPEKKSKVPMMIILLLVLLLVAAGGYIIYDKFLTPLPELADCPVCERCEECKCDNVAAEGTENGGSGAEGTAGESTNKQPVTYMNVYRPEQIGKGAENAEELKLYLSTAIMHGKKLYLFQNEGGNRREFHYYLANCSDNGSCSGGKTYDEWQTVTFDKDVRFLIEGGLGQDDAGNIIVAVLVDGTVQWIPVYKCIVEETMIVEKIDGVNGVVAAMPVRGNDHVTTILQRADGQYYNVSSYIREKLDQYFHEAENSLRR